MPHPSSRTAPLALVAALSMSLLTMMCGGAPTYAQTRPAPLRLAVVGLDASVAEAVAALDAVLANSPNVARREAQAVMTAAADLKARQLAMCRDGVEVVLRVQPARASGAALIQAYGPDGRLALRLERPRALGEAGARDVLTRTFAATARQVLRDRQDNPARCERLLAASRAGTVPVYSAAAPSGGLTDGAQVAAPRQEAPRTPHVHPWRWIEVHGGSIIRAADGDEGDGPVFTGLWLRLRLGEPFSGFAVRRELSAAYLPISWGSGGRAWRLEVLTGPSWGLGKRWTLELLGSFQLLDLRADETPRGGPRRATFISLLGVGRASVWLGNRVELRFRMGSGGNLYHREGSQSAPRGQLVTSGLSVGVRVARVLIDLGFDVDLLMYDRFEDVPEAFQRVNLGVGFLAW